MKGAGRKTRVFIMRRKFTLLMTAEVEGGKFNIADGKFFRS